MAVRILVPLGATAQRSKGRAGASSPLFVLFALALALPGCPPASQWEGGRPVSDRTLAALFGLDPGDADEADPLAPDVPARSSLRPCCAFGADLKVAVGRAPVPGFSMGNVLGVDDLGPHNYDNPAIGLRRSHADSAPITNENNGLVYTCHGGFIDVAHVRDYADWTVFLSAQVARHFDTGTTIELPDEGGQRRVILRPLPGELRADPGILRVAVELGQWLAFQLSVWHEIITWWGWSSVPAFPEKVSAFSPEDLYSNRVGAKIGAALVYDRAAGATTVYNRHMDYTLRRVLELLKPIPEEQGKDAMFHVDGVWWDSSKRLPAAEVVIRRNMDLGDAIAPWTIGRAELDPLVPESVEALCAEDDRPLVLDNPDGLDGWRFRDLATFEVEVEEGLTGLPVPPGRGRRVTQEDFSAIIAVLRAENAAEFGKGSDRPGRYHGSARSDP